jgi:uncharacterized protein YjhX (UPF0386 family)
MRRNQALSAIVVFIADGKIAIPRSKNYAIALVKCLFYEDYEQCNIAIAVLMADGKLRLFVVKAMRSVL